MTDIKSLVERLRVQAAQIAADGHFGWSNLDTDAAALIEQQAARIAELEAGGEAVAWALKGRSGIIRELADNKDATSNWHPDFVIPLYESSAVGRDARLMPIVRDLLTASDLLSKRWKAQNAEVGKRLFAHAETLAALAASEPKKEPT